MLTLDITYDKAFLIGSQFVLLVQTYRIYNFGCFITSHLYFYKQNHTVLILLFSTHMVLKVFLFLKFSKIYVRFDNVTKTETKIADHNAKMQLQKRPSPLNIK